MRQRDALYVLAAVTLACLWLSEAVHPAIAPLCGLWLVAQRAIMERHGVRLPEVALTLLHVWLGLVFLGFAFLGERTSSGTMDMLELLLAFGAPFLILKLVAPPSRFNDAVAVLASLVLALGSAATAPGYRPLFILVAFLVTVCFTLPRLLQREEASPDGSRIRLIGRVAAWSWSTSLAAGSLAAAGLVGGVALYVLVPRLEPKQDELEARSELGIGARGGTRAGGSRSGFARTMRLGDIGRIKRDDRVAFEARVTYYGKPFDPPVYRSSMLLFRARAWNRYDPDVGEWERTTGRSRPLPRDGLIERGDTPVDWTVRMHGYDGLNLFLPQRARRVRAEGASLRMGPMGAVVADREIREYGVEAGDPVTSRVDLRRLVVDDSDRTLSAVPASLEPVLRRFLPAGYHEQPVSRRIGLVHQLFTQGGFRYTLDLPESLPEGTDPVAAFLERREGHCELFASAGCLILRAMGVPARVAGGMRLAEPVGKGHYIARYRNAHAWVEVPFRDVGFVAIDFTPPDERAVTPSDLLASGAEAEARLGIDRRGSGAGDGTATAFDWGDPLRFTAKDQARMRERLGELLGAFPVRETFGLALLAVLAIAVRRWFVRARTSPLRVHGPDGGAARALAFYRRFLRRCAAKGHRRKPHQTPREFLAALPAELRVEGAEITARFESLRYDA